MHFLNILTNIFFPKNLKKKDFENLFEILASKKYKDKEIRNLSILFYHTNCLDKKNLQKKDLFSGFIFLINKISKKKLNFILKREKISFFYVVLECYIIFNLNMYLEEYEMEYYKKQNNFKTWCVFYCIIGALMIVYICIRILRMRSYLK